MPDDVRSSFAPVAQNYSRSTFHAGKRGIEEVIELAEPKPGELALDVATGTGNAAFALAGHLERVIGLDLTPEMLAEARRVAAERGIENVTWVFGDAQALPFPDATFDVYMVRAAPHHFPDLPLALREAARVLKGGGRACFIDCAPPAAAREVLHGVELRRDPSHVQSRTVDEWVELLGEAGLVVERADQREVDWDHDDWMNNMAVPAERRPELARMVEAAEGAARAQLRPERREGKLWHAYWHCLIRARKPWS
ncbi:MAG TPA: methyltransferase domain-containing protein [Candidatus Dormibacteraeota bacterium]